MISFVIFYENSPKTNLHNKILLYFLLFSILLSLITLINYDNKLNINVIKKKVKNNFVTTL